MPLPVTAFADYRFAEGWDASLGIRRSGRQYGALDNGDFVDTYGAVSAFTVADAKLRWQFAPRWTASLGVDNLTNARYREYTSLLRYFADQPGWELRLRLSLDFAMTGPGRHEHGRHEHHHR